MLTDAEREAAIDQAVADAAETIDDATDDQVERDSLWQRMICGCFISVLSEADEGTRASIVERLNDALAQENTGWQLVRSDG